LMAHIDNTEGKRSDVRGSIGYDPLDQLLLDGSLSINQSRIFDLGADLVQWTRKNAPGLRPIVVSGRVVHEAGGSEGQEIAWQLAVGIEWMRALTARGISAND